MNDTDYSVMGDGETSYGALLMLEYLHSLFSASPKESFMREEVLRIIECVGSDPEMFTPEALVTFANSEVQSIANSQSPEAGAQGENADA